jgi:hypothetical protein
LSSPRAVELAQGDIVEDIEFFRPKAAGYRDTVHLPGIVVSHSCDFTKFKADEDAGRTGLDQYPLLVTAVSRESSIADAGTRGHAQAGRVARYLYLPAEAPFADEGRLVDFWWIQPVAVFELVNTRRLASMTDEWQRNLQIALDRFFSWENRRQPVPGDQ